MMSTLPCESVVPVAKDGHVSNTGPQILGCPLTIRPFGHASFFTKTRTMAFGSGMSMTFGFDVPSCTACVMKFTFNVADGLTVCVTITELLARKSALPW